jgi:predicted CXXCH cytochrome family protein
MLSKQITKAGYFSMLSSVLLASTATAGTISGSAHDFSVTSWSGGEICVVCHTPHNAIPEDDAPLWNHEVTQATFVMYDSPTFDSFVEGAQPSGSSKLCLSCHDGTVALDSFGDNIGSGSIFLPENSQAYIGTDLSNDHPISFVYDPALAELDGGLHDPTVQTVTIGSGEDTKGPLPIDDLMLYDGMLQCASCHDVHNKFTVDYKLLKVTTDGSELCLKCHDK